MRFSDMTFHESYIAEACCKPMLTSMVAYELFIYSQLIAWIKAVAVKAPQDFFF